MQDPRAPRPLVRDPSLEKARPQGKWGIIYVSHVCICGIPLPVYQAAQINPWCTEWWGQESHAWCASNYSGYTKHCWWSSCTLCCNLLCSEHFQIEGDPQPVNTQRAPKLLLPLSWSRRRFCGGSICEKLHAHCLWVKMLHSLTLLLSCIKLLSSFQHLMRADHAMPDQLSFV